jgi:hypothetical protein
MKRFRFPAIALAVLMMCALCTLSSASASDGSTSGVRPFWTNADQIDLGLAFSGTTASCEAKITGITGTTKIVASFVLERKSGGTYAVVKTFPTKTAYSEVLRFSGTYTVTAGYTYRLSVSAVVTRNGTDETVTSWTERIL